MLEWMKHPVYYKPDGVMLFVEMVFRSCIGDHAATRVEEVNFIQVTGSTHLHWAHTPSSTLRF